MVLLKKRFGGTSGDLNEVSGTKNSVAANLMGVCFLDDTSVSNIPPTDLALRCFIKTYNRSVEHSIEYCNTASDCFLLLH